jgi:hypothetical protein
MQWIYIGVYIVFDVIIMLCKAVTKIAYVKLAIFMAIMQHYVKLWTMYFHIIYV